MNWNNVKLIYLRELRDQLRDRRTLFTIAVLPLLLYPLLGMSFFQVQQFLKNDSRVRLVGAEVLPEGMRLVEDGRFSTEYCAEDLARQLKLQLEAASDDNKKTDTTGAKESDKLDPREALAEREIREGKYDLVVYFPPNFSQQLIAFRQNLLAKQRTPATHEPPSTEAAAEELLADQVPGPEIYKNTAIERSRLAHDRVAPILRQWRESIVGENLRQSRLPAATIRPFEVVSHDVAEEKVRRAAVWSKLLPFVLLIWALTGAFYPAIDLCAGEKERGTLETLLSSAAQRSEIVWGKLLTVMSFSMATSLLNLASLGVTGRYIASAFEKMGSTGLGPPPIGAVFWLTLALIPISALFAALSLAIATFARSSKEGQYYLMPLLLGSLPLMTLPMLPSVELNVGFSLIPITNVMLLLRSLIEGQYWDALRYAPLVIGVMAACCLLAIRWAIDQFNDESVLFRESERFDVRLWMTHLVRDRQDTPTVGQALFCGVLLLVIRFFASFSITAPENWSQFATTTLILQTALIATPACLMAIMLTRRPLRTLLLQRPSFALTAPAAALLAVLLHPTMVQVGEAIRRIYPISDEVLRAFEPIEALMRETPLWQVLLLAAVTPAICEELAFRGFVLSGLRRLGHKWAAIVLCSIFFGLAHSLLQQSLAACLTGIVIGYVAVKTDSLLPAALYHMLHNGLSVVQARLSPELLLDYPLLKLLWTKTEDGAGLQYHLPATFVMGALAVGLLGWFKRLPYRASAEERLQHALDHQSSAAVSA